MLSLLDATALPPMTAWHIIDESWLAKWRRFVMGRGPRRYLPPGQHIITISLDCSQYYYSVYSISC